jgi:hypothetical protein
LNDRTMGRIELKLIVTRAIWRLKGLVRLPRFQSLQHANSEWFAFDKQDGPALELILELWKVSSSSETPTQIDFCFLTRIIQMCSSGKHWFFTHDWGCAAENINCSMSLNPGEWISQRNRAFIGLNQQFTLRSERDTKFNRYRVWQIRLEALKLVCRVAEIATAHCMIWRFVSKSRKGEK